MVRDVWRERTMESPGTSPSFSSGVSVSGRDAFGGVLVREAGKFLLREPKGHHGGYVWNPPKGRRGWGKAPRIAALRDAPRSRASKGSPNSSTPTRRGFSSHPIGRRATTHEESSPWVSHGLLGYKLNVPSTVAVSDAPIPEIHCSLGRLDLGSDRDRIHCRGVVLTNRDEMKIAITPWPKRCRGRHTGSWIQTYWIRLAIGVLDVAEQFLYVVFPLRIIMRNEFELEDISDLPSFYYHKVRGLTLVTVPCRFNDDVGHGQFSSKLCV